MGHTLTEPTEASESEDAYLTVRDAADVLKCSESHVRRLLRDGAIPKIRIGPKLIRIKRSDLAAYLGRDD